VSLVKPILPACSNGTLQSASEFKLNSPVDNFFGQATVERVILSSAARSMVVMPESDVKKHVESVIQALESTDTDVQ
jgi:N-acetyl-beta-hexosaminidase